MEEEDTFLFTVGVDESGRGCWAGNVFAGAVVLGEGEIHPRVMDSKLLKKEKERGKIADHIQKNSLAWGIASSNVKCIDETNILNATLKAMRRAIKEVYIQLQYLKVPFRLKVLVDGCISPYRYKPLPYWVDRLETIVKGDSKEKCISAASILAKNAKDVEMNTLHILRPEYNWAKNKSYGTKEHRNAIKEFGLCDYHRKSFKIG